MGGLDMGGVDKHLYEVTLDNNIRICVMYVVAGDIASAEELVVNNAMEYWSGMEWQVINIKKLLSSCHRQPGGLNHRNRHLTLIDGVAH